MTPHLESQSRARLVLVAVALATLGWIVLAMSRFAEHPVLFDDSYISFNYARALAEGRGLTFNLEDGPLEGFTNLGWVLILAAVYPLGIPLEDAARYLGLASYAGTFVVCAIVLVRARVKLPVLVASCVLLGALALPYGLPEISGAGLETPLASFLLVALTLLLISGGRPTRAEYVAAAFLQLGLILTRLDGAIFVGAFGLMVVARAVAHHRRLGPVVAEVLRFEGPAFLGLLFLLAWKWFYFGDLLPNTYYAKSADTASWSAGWAYWKTFLTNSPQTYVLLLLALLSPLRGFGAWVGRYAWCAIVLYVVYCAKVGADFMYYRFAFEAYPLLVVAALIGLVRLGEAVPRASIVWVLSIPLTAGALYLSTFPPILEKKFQMQSLDEMNGYAVMGEQVGRRMAEMLPPDTRISTTLAGTIPYYTRFFTIDEWGLNDRTIGRRPSKPVRGRGHVKRAGKPYMRKRGVNIMMGHPSVRRCSRLRDEKSRAAYLRLGDKRCLRLRYLVSDPELTKLFCTSPDFIPLHIDCEGESLPSPRSGKNETPPKKLSDAEFKEARAGALAVHSLDGRTEGRFIGVAFGKKPVRGPLPDQTRVVGRSRGFLDSYHGGDATEGAFVLDLPSATTEVALRVGGGSDCKRAFVALVRDGVIVSRACGRRDEKLRPVLLDAGEPEGPLQLMAIDRAGGSWGHLLVDEIVAVGPKAPAPGR